MKERERYGIFARWTDLQVRFVDEYIKHRFNATAAASAAGCRGKDLGKVGSRLLAYPHVQQAIERERAKRRSSREDELSYSLLEVVAIQAMADRSSIYRPDFSVRPLSEWTPEQRLLIDSVSHQSTADGTVIATPKLISRKQSQDLLARMVGALRERLEISGDNFSIEVKRVKDRVIAAKQQIEQELDRAKSTKKSD